jgi:hypothetical protein
VYSEQRIVFYRESASMKKSTCPKCQSRVKRSGMHCPSCGHYIEPIARKILSSAQVLWLLVPFIYLGLSAYLFPPDLILSPTHVPVVITLAALELAILWLVLRANEN